MTTEPTETQVHTAESVLESVQALIPKAVITTDTEYDNATRFTIQLPEGCVMPRKFSAELKRLTQTGDIGLAVSDLTELGADRTIQREGKEITFLILNSKLPLLHKAIDNGRPARRAVVQPAEVRNADGKGSVTGII